MRISIANYYRHASVAPQEDFMRSFDPKLADDCSEPAIFRRMAGLDFPMPYAEPILPLPTLKHA